MIQIKRTHKKVTTLWLKTDGGNTAYFIEMEHNIYF